jgi:FKBP-type peptidyl-prolyl cis-trans isomerase
MMRVLRSAVATVTLLLALAAVSTAWTSQPLSRSNFIQLASAGSLLSFVQPSAAVELPNGVSYTVIKEGKGPAPAKGELAAIRFAAYAGDIKIDDIFDSPEPYYTRIGGGGLIKGVEDTLPLMRLGDRWKMTIPVRGCCLSLCRCSFLSKASRDILYDTALTEAFAWCLTRHIGLVTGQTSVWGQRSPVLGRQAPNPG